MLPSIVDHRACPATREERKFDFDMPQKRIPKKKFTNFSLAVSTYNRYNEINIRVMVKGGSLVFNPTKSKSGNFDCFHEFVWFISELYRETNDALVDKCNTLTSQKIQFIETSFKYTTTMLRQFACLFE